MSGALPGAVRGVDVLFHEALPAGIVRGDVGVGVVPAAVDDADRHRWTPGRRGPRLRRIDIRVRRADVEAEIAKDPRKAEELLAGVVESPLLVEVVIAKHDGDRGRASGRTGRGRDAADVVGLCKEDVGGVAVAR